MTMLKLKFAAVAAVLLLGLSFEVGPAKAGGCWDGGCGGVVLVYPVAVYQTCSCGSARYEVGYAGGYALGGGYGGGYALGFSGGYGAGYHGAYRGGLYRRAGYAGYRGGLYRRAVYGGYRGGLYRRGY